jgi:hypothetical protein
MREYIARDIRTDTSKKVHVRFMADGQAVSNMRTGTLDPKGINIISQTVYWDIPENTVREIKGCLVSLNPSVTFRVVRA